MQHITQLADTIMSATPRKVHSQYRLYRIMAGERCETWNVTGIPTKPQLHPSKLKRCLAYSAEVIHAFALGGGLHQKMAVNRRTAVNQGAAASLPASVTLP